MEQQLTQKAGENASLRQIAILLHSLPERTHRVLLGQLDGDAKQRVADELLALSEVDAMEQYRVLKLMREQLHAETQSIEKVESEIQDEIQIGRARVSKKRSHTIYRSNEPSLGKSGEGNVTIASDATVVSQRPGRSDDGYRADQPGVGFHTQSDVVTGQAAMSPTPEVLQSMFAQFHQTQAAGVLPEAVRTHHAAAASTSASNTAANPVTRPHSAFDQPQILPIGSGSGSAVAGTSPTRRNEAHCSAEQLAEKVDRYLTALPPKDLCRALGMVSTKQAFLVLCGLPNEIAETVLEMLPRRQSRKARSSMRRMGKLHLSDIDAAKRVVAEVAIRMTNQPGSLAA